MAVLPLLGRFSLLGGGGSFSVSSFRETTARVGLISFPWRHPVRQSLSLLAVVKAVYDDVLVWFSSARPRLIVTRENIFSS